MTHRLPKLTSASANATSQFGGSPRLMVVWDWWNVAGGISFSYCGGSAPELSVSHLLPDISFLNSICFLSCQHLNSLTLLDEPIDTVTHMYIVYCILSYLWTNLSREEFTCQTIIWGLVGFKLHRFNLSVILIIRKDLIHTECS